MKKSKEKSLGDYPKTNLVFHFIDPTLSVHFEEGAFTSDKENEIANKIFALKQSIWIDKTYVGYASSKYSDVFLTPDGWKQICELLSCSDYGKNLSPSHQKKITEVYSVMIVCYLMTEIEKYGVDLEHVGVEIDSSNSIEVEIYKDSTPNDLWKKYPGKWQEWSWESSNYLNKRFTSRSGKNGSKFK